MSISKAIYKILSSETDLTNLVSTRIFPSIVPQNETYPSILFEIKDIEPIEIKARRHTKTQARVVIGVHATTYGDVQNIADIVIATLERYKDETDYTTPPTGVSGTPYTAGCSIVAGYWIQQVFYDTSFDVFNDNLRVYEKYLEFDVRYMVNPASMGAYGWFPTIISGNTSTYNGLLSTLDVDNAPPTTDGEDINLFYDGSGETTLNLVDTGAFNPDWYSGGYIRFRCGFSSGLGVGSPISFPNGNTIFFVFQTDVAASDYTIWIMNDSAGNRVQLKSLSGARTIAVAINGSDNILYSATENILANKMYFAFSWGGENDETGEWEVADPNSSTYNNKDNYNQFSDADAGNFEFKNLGSLIAGSPTSLDTNNRIFETVIFDKKLTFGGGQYNRIKDYLLNKHNLD